MHDLSAAYAEMSPEQLLELAHEQDQLTEAARLTLTLELRKRGLAAHSKGPGISCEDIATKLADCEQIDDVVCEPSQEDWKRATLELNPPPGEGGGGALLLWIVCAAVPPFVLLLIWLVRQLG